MQDLAEYGEDRTNRISKKEFLQEANELLRSAVQAQRELEAAASSKYAFHASAWQTSTTSKLHSPARLLGVCGLRSK